MKADERRKKIVDLLLASEDAISGSVLAEKLHVSRQIVVQDITILKASGYEILSTHQGYIIIDTPLAERIFKLRHTTEQTEDELTCIVELGGTVVDVFVWHKVYGKIAAKMNLSTKEQIAQFMDDIKSGKSTELMHITSGYHYHTVRADSKELLDQIEEVLNRKGYIVPELSDGV